MSDPADAALEHILDLAEDTLERGDPAGAMLLCAQILGAVPDHPGALFVLAEAHRDLREIDDAEAIFRLVLKSNPNHSPSWSALGAVLFDDMRFEQAMGAISRAIRIDDRNSEAYYWRAMLRERKSDFNGADRDYLRACRLSPLLYPLPVVLDERAVESIIDEALRPLHPSIRSYLQQVAILLEEVPSEDTLLQYDPPMPAAETLGYYSGVPMAHRSADSPWTNLPSAIVLFRRNLQRIAWDREGMIEELRMTVFHEIGHFLGLSNQDLQGGTPE